MAIYTLAFKKMLINEGGYVNDKDDPGGETYKGVARKIWPNWKGWDIIDGLKKSPGLPGTLDANLILHGHIMDFYEQNYWGKVRGNDFTNQEIAESIFDFGVNAGNGTSVCLALLAADLPPDGKLNDSDVAVINSMDPEKFLASFALAKISKYVGICNKNPVMKKYFFGWIVRSLKMN
jgi:lysozyme family protein